VGGVDVAVDVGFDHGVHGDDAEAADDLGVVGDLLLADDDLIAILADVGHDVVDAFGRERERGRGEAAHFSGF